jgi:hypothetical protein
MSKCKNECPDCGCDHDVMEGAMHSLQDLLMQWHEDGLSPSKAIDVIVSTLVAMSEVQDDPDGALTDLKKRIDAERATKPEDREFVVVVAN